MKDSVRKHALLAIVLLVVGTLFVPAVSAEEYNFVLNDTSYKEQTSLPGGSSRYLAGPYDVYYLCILNANEIYGNELVQVDAQTPSSGVSNYNSLPQSAVTRVNIGNFLIADYGYFKFKVGTEDYLQCYLSNIEQINDYPKGLKGTQKFLMVKDDPNFVFPKTAGSNYYNDLTGDYNLKFAFGIDHSYLVVGEFTHYSVFSHKWTQTLQINTGDYDTIVLDRNGLSSILYIETPKFEYTNNPAGNSNYEITLYPSLHRPFFVSVKNPITNKYFNYTVNLDGVTEPGEPAEEPTPTPTEEPGEHPVLRNGTVTMTDHNGTPITGFEVTAVNYYTQEEYTVTTDTDVAVISLPMDRTTTIRNPQTGEYETAPIGYYKFYGQAPGYKMLNEDGIHVAVMPEKYGSYQLCDILVTSESGYLTGKHKFQIRSRSDNSILQTGTISAKSATTEVWYNTTVSDGIATLVLPYDTSNPISQYAGNYYVYATSPGYEDSDYGTQIVVMPHTVSEIYDIHLTPIGGVPTAGNVTLRIQAFSEYGPGVANASIFIAGVVGAGSSVWDTYTASSTGYLAVSVPGNSTYDIVASAEGYYDSARRIEVFTEPPGLIEMKLYLSGAPTVEPTTQPTGWPTTQPTTTPTGGIPDDDDGSESFLMQAVRGIGKAFGVGFSTAKLIFGMLLALSIGFATAKHLRGGAAEFGLGLVGGTMLGVLIGLLPVWTVVVLLLIVGLYIGNRYIGGANNG